MAFIEATHAFYSKRAYHAYIYIEVGCMNKKADRIKERLSDAFELPKEIILDMAKTTVLGSRQVSIENHKGIIEYDEKIVRINTGNGIVKIEGNSLIIKYVLQEEIIIEGDILAIIF